jgi:hypothetical protein
MEIKEGEKYIVFFGKPKDGLSDIVLYEPIEWQEDFGDQNHFFRLKLIKNLYTPKNSPGWTIGSEHSIHSGSLISINNKIKIFNRLFDPDRA